MKITKNKLKQLIKEELERTLEDRGAVDDQADVTTLFRRIPDELIDKVDRPFEILDLLDELLNRVGSDDLNRAAAIIKPYLRQVLIQLGKMDDETAEKEISS